MRPELRAAVVQDATSGRVLMLGWMDAEAEQRTRDTGQVWFWSRSRQRLWRKGETSGNTLALIDVEPVETANVDMPPTETPPTETPATETPATDVAPTEMTVVELQDDCDHDALLVRVAPAGPTCHTGSVSCFAPDLWQTISQRALERPAGSYVTSLLEAGTAQVARKVGEEAVEVAVAALTESDERLVEEAADLVFHLYVLLAARGIDLTQVEDELGRRGAARAPR